MILKYVLISVATLFLVTSSDPYFGFQLGRRILPSQGEDVVESPVYSLGALEPYLKDHGDRVSPDFKITDFYSSSVRFWFLIYTRLDSRQVAIHDRNNLSIIYKVLDFRALDEKNLGVNTLYILQQKLSRERLQDVRENLGLLVRDPHNMGPEAREIYRAIRNAGVALPSTPKERSALFRELRDNLRAQTGQSDHIEAGLRRSLPYLSFIRDHFEKKNLPQELSAIPFLESSFNPRAHSRVSALGVWQFMPLTGTYYLPKKSGSMDYRSNVGLSSVAAGHLLSENHRIMKKWDLTVTSYNSGTKHLVKSRRELASLEDVDLEDIIRHSSSSAFGFASKNFYAEFLALAHVLAYEEDLFPAVHVKERDDIEDKLRFFVSRCQIRLGKVFSPEELDEIAFYNHHLTDLRRDLSKGTIVTTKSRLPAGKFLEIEGKNLLSLKPKDWPGLVRSQSCSTR